jgi:DNA replication protein DnaC
MGYSADVIQKARERLANTKAERESIQGQRLAEAYRQIPRLREIDRLLRQTMAVTVQTAFSKGEDVQARIDRVKQENQQLQAERKALIEANFQPGWLDETPLCSRCGGSGYIGSTMCSCLEQLCREEQKKEISFLADSYASFDNFKLSWYPDRVDPKLGFNIRQVMEHTFNVCRNYADSFRPGVRNLLFSGDTGLGKTYLSACIAKVVTDKGYAVSYETAGHLFTNMERAKFENDGDARAKLQRYADCDLLILDDLGTEMVSQYTISAFYTLINDRILAGKPTIISTNLTSEAMAQRYNPQIASRLRGGFHRIAFLGDDIRVQMGLGY